MIGEKLLYKFLKFMLIGLFFGCFLLNNLQAKLGGRFDNFYLLNAFSQTSVLMAEHKYLEAKQEINKVLLSFSSSSDIQLLGHFDLGRVEYRLNNYVVSNKEYQYVISHVSSEDSDAAYFIIPHAITQIGLNYMEMGQYSLATIQFIKVLNYYSDSIEDIRALNGLADSLSALGEDTEIENILLTISQNHPNSKLKFYALDELASKLYKENNYDKSLSVCQQIIEELDVNRYPDLQKMKDKISNINIPWLQKKIQEINSKQK